jgi:hypothetical protein
MTTPAEEQPTVVTRVTDEDEGDYPANFGNSFKTAENNLELPTNKTGDAAEAARDAANVLKPEYVGYEAALNAYGNRSDVESLVARRRRENAEDIGAQDFTRAENYPASEPAQA